MRFKVVANYNSDHNIYKFVNDIWNFNGEYELTSGDDYTHLIIFQKYEKCNIKVPKENVYGFIIEPYWSTNFDKDLPSYCNSVFHYQPEEFKSYNNVIKTPGIALHRLFDCRYHGELQYGKENTTKAIIESDFIKSKELSIIINFHWDEDSHINKFYKIRQDFVRDLLKSDLDFDMYGQDWNTNDRRYKGFLPNKIDGIKDYKFSICLENCNISGEITEKMIDVLLCNTIPIYNGNRDVEIWYPNSCEYLEYGADAVSNIKKILETKNIKDYDLGNAKNLYLNKYNPFKMVKNMEENGHWY